MNWAELKKKKKRKKKKKKNWCVGRRTPHWGKFDVGVVVLEPHLCFITFMAWARSAFTGAKFSKIHFFKVAFKAICNKLLLELEYTLMTCMIRTNVMELTNIEIQTIWLQPLLCIDMR